MKKPEPKEPPAPIVDIRITWPGLTTGALKSIRRQIAAIAKPKTFTIKLKKPCKTSN
jgi:hypothetical protein